MTDATNLFLIAAGGMLLILFAILIYVAYLAIQVNAHLHQLKKNLAFYRDRDAEGRPFKERI